MRNRLASSCRLVLITDGRGDVERVVSIVEGAVAGGVRAVQLREERMPARELARLCERLRPLLDDVSGLLLVNDRADVAAQAHGVHLGRRSLPPTSARRLLGVDAVLGFSAHDADEMRWAAQQGADYVSLSPVFPTASKPGVPALGLARAHEIAMAAPIPVVWLGGFDLEAVAAVASREPFGVAVMSAICSAADPQAAAAGLLARLAAHPARR